MQNDEWESPESEDWMLAADCRGHRIRGWNGATGTRFDLQMILEAVVPMSLARFEQMLIGTPTNHVQHHEKLRGNYGLYFNVRDRLMGTNHRDYEARYREVTTRAADPGGGRGAIWVVRETMTNGGC